MSAPTPGLSQLMDIADPALPNRTSPIVSLTLAENAKRTLLLLGAALVLGIISYFAWNYMRIASIGSGLLALLCAIGAFSSKGKKASCPFCGAMMDGIFDDKAEGKEIRCEKCGEYSIASPGVLRPLAPGAVAEQPKYESPVFRNAAWPRACVVCGEPPTRLDDMRKTSVGGVQALLGKVSVMWGSVQGIPYCDNHRDGLGLRIDSEKKMYLKWRSLRIMRRYLAANRGHAQL